jgi:hypothetical protein
MSGCVNSTTQVTETEEALCIVFGLKLPKRSRQDTELTRYEIQQLYAEYIDQCPKQATEIPWLSQYVDMK